MEGKELVGEIARRVEDAVRVGMKDALAGAVARKVSAAGTPSKKIDIIAENTALDVVRENGNNYNVLSEEIGFVDNGAKETLVLDPVDGTYDAISGITFYSVSIAIGKKRQKDVWYGLVRNICTSDEYWAEKGKGSYFNGTRISPTKFRGEESVISVYLSKYTHPKTYDIVKRARRARALGCSSLEMCLVAAGKLDMYYQRGHKVRVTDIAASTLIVRESGGEVYDADNGKALDLEITLDDRANVAAIGDESTLKAFDVFGDAR